MTRRRWDSRVAVAVGAADAQRLRTTPPLYLLHGRAGELLPALVRAAWPGAEV
jgi:hypothetical protein